MAVPNGTDGPFVSEGDPTLLVWAAQTQAGADSKAKSSERSWYSLVVSADGAKSEPLALAPASAALEYVALRRLVTKAKGQGMHAVLSTRQGSVGDALDVLVVGPHGELRRGPFTLAEPGADILWIDAVATSSGVLVLWAVSKDGRATIYGAGLDSDGAPTGQSRALIKDALAWQTAGIGNLVALATVRAAGGETASGKVSVDFFSAKGESQGKSVSLSTEPTAELDLDMVAAQGGLTVAWSEKKNLVPTLVTARLDAAGNLLQKAKPATAPRGEQTLVALVPPFGNGPAYIVWENLRERREQGRRMLLAPLNEQGGLESERAQVTIPDDPSHVPEFAASKDGLALLTLSPMCAREASECSDSENWPTFAEFDRKLELLATEPYRLEPLKGAPVKLAWGLQCSAAGCFSLAASYDLPAPVYRVRLQARSNDWRAVGAALAPPGKPRLSELSALVDLESLAEVATTRVEERTVLSWLTYFDPTTPWERRKQPAPDGRYDPIRALLQVAEVGPKGLGEVTTISYRARSLGGVAMAHDPQTKQTLVAWSALDNQEPQVFLTLLNAQAQRVSQRMLTRAKGEVSDVSVARVADGWLVSWVDERDGDPEVYVAKVNAALRAVGPEQRVTRAAGAATGVSLLDMGEESLMVWADARAGAQPGWADIYLSKVSNKDGRPLSAGRSLSATTPHSYAPILTRFGQGAVVAWVEARSDASEKDNGVMLAELDAEGRFVAPPALITPPQGAVTMHTLDCTADECHLVLSVGSKRAELQVVKWSPKTGPSEPRRLTGLLGPSEQTLAPVLSGKDLFIGDAVAAGKTRVYRMQIDW